jgi:hypothetical protein
MSKRGGHDDQAQVGDHDAGDLRLLARPRRGVVARLRTEGHADQPAQHEGDRDRQHHAGKLRLTDDQAHHPCVDQPAQRGCQRDRGQRGQPERPAQADDQAPTDEAGGHQHVAMREVQHLGGLVGQHQAQRDQRVDRADGHAVDRQLRDLSEFLAHAGRALRAMRTDGVLAWGLSPDSDSSKQVSL